MQTSFPQITDDEREIADLLRGYEQSLNRSDADQAAACFTADGVLMQTMLPTARGPSLSASYAQGFAKRTLEVTFTLDELVVTGPWPTP